MSDTEDWSEFIPPGTEVELAGKWKHGWIPLDATAISAKMKGNTGGKKWWGDGKSAPGVLKKNRGDGKVGKHAARPSGKRMLTVKDVPSAKAGKRKPSRESAKEATPGKTVMPDKGPAKTKILKVDQVPGARAGQRQETFHVTEPKRAEAIKKQGFHGKPRTAEEGFGGDYFGAGTYVHTDKEHSDKYLEGVQTYAWGDEVQITTQTKLQRPFRVTGTVRDASPTAVVSEAMAKKGLAKPGERLSGPEITRRLKAAGYDGVDFKQIGGYNDDMAGSQQVVFDPKNVRVPPKLKTDPVLRLKTGVETAAATKASSAPSHKPTIGDNYVKMHGVAGARKKLDALKKKPSSEITRERIQLLEEAIRRATQ